MAKYNIRQQVKSYLIEPKSPVSPPQPTVTKHCFCQAEQSKDKTAQRNSHFALSQPAVDSRVTLRHRRFTRAAAARIYRSRNPPPQSQHRCTLSLSKSTLRENSTRPATKTTTTPPPRRCGKQHYIIIDSLTLSTIRAGHARAIRLSVEPLLTLSAAISLADMHSCR